MRKDLLSDLFLTLPPQAHSSVQDISLLQRHELLPFFYSHHLKQHPDHPLYTTCRQAYEKNLAKNMLYSHLCQEILEEAQKRSLSIVPLKGIWLFSQIYLELERVINDLDLFVVPQDWQPALLLVQKVGWQPFFDNRGSHILFHHPSGARLELHYSLSNQAILPEKMLFPASPARLAQRCIRGTLWGIPCPLLPLEDHFLYLCTHLFRERFASYKWWGDLLLLYPLCSKQKLKASAHTLKMETVATRFQSLLQHIHSGQGEALAQKYARLARRPLLRFLLLLTFLSPYQHLYAVPFTLYYRFFQRPLLLREQAKQFGEKDTLS